MILSKIFSFLSSSRLMALLFVSFAVSMAAGTFIESEYNTDTARIWVYNAWWFELIMVLFVFNFVGNISKYRLLRKEKWATLLLHLSFILIIVGAGVTRYLSYEGVMPIREGETATTIYSDKAYVTALVDGNYQGEPRRRTFEKGLYLSPVTSNKFTLGGFFNETTFEVTYKDFIMNAVETITEDESGVYYLKMVESGDGTRHEHYLKEGEVQNIHNILYAFNKETEGAINIIKKDNEYFIKAPFAGDYMRMADQAKGKVAADSLQVLNLRSLYNMANTSFVFPEFAKKGKKTYVSNNDFKDKKTDDVLVVNLTANGETKELTLVGSAGKQGIPQSVTIGDLDYTLFFGSKLYELPFALKLDDFIADKYPGTEKRYAAFKSKLELIDKAQNKSFKDSVYMNHILDYGGFRFFQSGFDPDEKGTILSVNHDFWGTWINYIGYFLLYLAMMAILFDKNTRFSDLKKRLDKVKLKKEALSLFLIFGFVTAQAQDDHDHTASDDIKLKEILNKYKVDASHAAEFGKLIIQDDGGRMKPINTFSSELLRKVSKSDTYEDFNADQAFLSMTQFPRYWYNVPVIYLPRGNDSIRKTIGIDTSEKYARLIDFFDAKGNYKLSQLLDDAAHAAIPNKFQKDFIETDKKVNLLYSAVSGPILKVYPIPNDANNKWVSYLEMGEAPKGTALDSIKNVIPFYLDALSKAAVSNDYALANSLLTGLSKYQHQFGGAVLPSDEKVQAEITYNKYDIFKNLYYLYMIAGVLMLLFAIVQLFTKSRGIKITVNVFHGLIIFLFVLHTIGLIARWYISGHAPWSDAYESMIYVAWATMFFGLAFGRQSKLTVASTAFVASMILMIAHWNWMDPAIANLQPVLNSYWLMIHVAVIVASYGPFALAMIIGLVTLFLMLFTTEKNKERMRLSIEELSIINELALTVGLVMLTIGNFLGGQWANESWGRYWGWDPKETWALISIMVYAFVIHMRFVPGLRSKWFYNLMSVVSFYSIMMTYFGVNFYLTGLHSYASGDKVVTPTFVYISVACLAVLGTFSFIKYNKHLKR